VTSTSITKYLCQNCGKQICIYLSKNQIEIDVECYNNVENNEQCIASYRVIDIGNNQVRWDPLNHEIKCQNKDCEGKIILWERQIKLNNRCKCSVCEGENIFQLCIVYEPKIVTT
jgi:hypothetical protein